MKGYKVVIQKQEMEMGDGEKLEIGSRWLMKGNDDCIYLKKEGDLVLGWGHWGEKRDFEDWFEITDEVVYE